MTSTEHMTKKTVTKVSSPLLRCQDISFLSNISYLSENIYELYYCSIGDKVYSDNSTLRWSYIPYQLREHVYISAPSADATLMIRDLVKFTIKEEIAVILLINSKISALPKWVSSEGYVKLVQQSLARELTDGISMEEYQYNMYGKIYTPGSGLVTEGSIDKIKTLSISFKSNFSDDINSDMFMYTAFLVPTRLYSPSVRITSALAGSSLVDDSLMGNKRNYDIEELNDLILTQISYPDYFTGSTNQLLPYLSSSIINTANGISTTNTATATTSNTTTPSLGYTIHGLNVIDNSWIEGGQGLSLYHADADKLIIGVQEGSAWSEEIAISAHLNSTNGYLEIPDWSSLKLYQLAYTSTHLHGIFNCTQLVTFMNRFVIINHLDEPLMVTQKDGAKNSNSILTILPYHAEPYHSSINAAYATLLLFSSQSTYWSLGAVDINEMGSSELLLPKQRNDQFYADDTCDNIEDHIVVHVEVKLAEKNENCSVVIIVWQSKLENEGSMALSVRNECEDVVVRIRQANVDFDSLRESQQYSLDSSFSTMLQKHKKNTTYPLPPMEYFDLYVPPGAWVPFGWTDPDCGHEVQVMATSALSLPSPSSGSGVRQHRVATISMLTAGVSLRLPINDMPSNTSVNNQSNKQKASPFHNEIILSVVVSKRGGRMLRIYRNNEHHMKHDNNNRDSSPSSARFLMKQSQWETLAVKKAQIKALSGLLLDFNCFLQSIAISLVLDHPNRREFMNATFSGITSHVEWGREYSAFEFFLTDLQVDNYSESMVYPAIVHR